MRHDRATAFLPMLPLARSRLPTFCLCPTSYTIANERNPSQLRGMSLEQVYKMKRDIAIRELQDQVRSLTNQIAQVKEAMGELACFEGQLNSNHYLKWVQTLEVYFEAKGYFNEESFMIATKKLQGPAILGLETLGEKELFNASLESRLGECLSLTWM